MKTFFTSDPHFGHARIIELCKRPFKSVSHMNEAMLENINATVSNEQRLVILGDICMGPIEESLQLLGRIEAAELVLIPGNHDRWSLWNKSKDEKRDFWRDHMSLVRPNTRVMKDVKPSYWLFADLVPDGWTVNPFEDVLFSHYPYAGNSQWTGDDKYDAMRPPDDGLPLIHGHVHEQWQTNGYQFNVGVDVNEFKPVSEDELCEWVGSL